MKTIITSSGFALLVMALLAGGCSKNNSTAKWSLKHSAAAAQLKSFVAEKEAQARAAARTDGQPMLPEYDKLFAAAAKGDWPTVRSTFNTLSRHAPQYAHGGTNDARLTGVQWAAVLETFGAIEDFASGDDKDCAAYGRDIINSIPPGGIYFGGTDPGRFLVTALQKSQVNGDPFFTLTQNALADGGYLEYLRSTYGDKIYIPTADDSAKCFQDYEADAKWRLQNHQLKRGENIRLDAASGRVQISGVVAVMEVNALIAKVIFDRNSDREFYIEESFPLDWMYPHLEPHGLIFKLNRQPLPELSDEIVQSDHDYWTGLIQPMIGGWLDNNTSMQEIADFAKKVFQQHDFTGFTGDREFVQNAYVQGMFSKERTNIADLYVWRMNHATDPAEKERMARAADFAFRQALALCPKNTQAAKACAEFLHSENRDADAALVKKM